QVNCRLIGLSAIDAFRHIEQKNLNTSVSMFSRHGLAPMCISSNKQYEPKYVNWHSIVKQKNCSPLKAFMRVMAQEKKALEDKGELKHAINLLHAGKQLEYFEYIHSRACNGDLPWQDVLVSTRSWFYKLWKIMPSKEKHFFNKNYGHLWGSWRHPIPLSVFSQLKNAVKQKRLKFYRSTAAPKYENNLFSVKTTQGQLSSHTFWDGTGGNFQLQHIDHPLNQKSIS
ncbi:MAG: hypothetical protein KAH18_12545, partial [Psychromonas sp.]|nr:hypothetical protein [Psychromonas sp.]